MLKIQTKSLRNTCYRVSLRKSCRKEAYSFIKSWALSRCFKKIKPNTFFSGQLSATASYFCISGRWVKLNQKFLCFEDHYEEDQHADNAQCGNCIQKLCDAQKKKLFFLCHVKMKIFLPRGYIFDLRDNKNTSQWHNILNVQNKNLHLHEKQCSTKKYFM